MIIFFLSLLAVFLLAYGLFRTAEVVFSLPRSQMHEAIRDLPSHRKFGQKLNDRLLVPVSRFIAKGIFLSEFKQKQMQADFDRLERKDTPQNFTAMSLTRSLLLAAAGFLFIPLGIPLLSLLTAVAAILAYFRATQDIRTRVEKVNHSISAELPRLVESLNYAMQDSRDLVSFFEKYRRVSGKALGRELDKLILDMKIGNQELALRHFEARISIPQLSALVSVLCGVHQGVDQRTSLLILEQDIRTTQREMLRREMEKRPGRIKVASFILTILMILMFMVPLILLILKNLQSVGL